MSLLFFYHPRALLICTQKSIPRVWRSRYNFSITHLPTQLPLPTSRMKPDANPDITSQSFSSAGLIHITNYAKLLMHLHRSMTISSVVDKRNQTANGLLNGYITGVYTKPDQTDRRVIRRRVIINPDWSININTA